MDTTRIRPVIRQPRPATRAALAVFAGAGVITALAACSPGGAAETTAPSTDPTADTAETSPSATTGTGDAAASGAYTDGTYEAEGSYQSPGGSESIGVSITLEGDVVTAVTVTPEATSGNSAQYQGQFADGIAAEVVGQNIDDLSVDKVSGSSLTSGGFNEAVETIKAEAAA